MVIRRSRIWFVLAALAAVLSGCANPHINRSADEQARQNVNTAQTRIEEASRTDDAIVRVHDDYYLDAQAIEIEKHPGWMDRTVNLSGVELPLDLWTYQAIEGTGVVAQYGPNVKRSRPVTLTYKGDVKGLLDRLSRITGYYYSADEQGITWSRLQTKTWHLRNVPSAQAYMIGEDSSSSQAANATGFGTTTQAVQTGVSNQGSQYAGLKSEIDVWEDVQKALENLRSEDGKVSVFRLTNTITASDYPHRIAAMDRFIESINRQLDIRVYVKVQLVEVQLRNTQNLSIDWNMVVKNAINRVGINTTSNIANSVITGMAATGSFEFLMPQGTGSNLDGSSILLQALREQGAVSVMTEPSVLANNGRIARMAFTKHTGYIASAQTTLNQSQSATGVTPGDITSGLMLYVVPQVVGNDIYLTLSTKLTSPPKITPKKVGPDLTLETPDYSDRGFLGTYKIRNGATLVMSGFKQTFTDSTDTDNFWGLLGLGKLRRNEDVQIVVLITARMV